MADFASFSLEIIRATALHKGEVGRDFQKLLTIFDKPVTMKNIVSRQVSLESYSRSREVKFSLS